MKYFYIAVLLAAFVDVSHAQSSTDDGFVDFSSATEVICGLRADGSVECSTSPGYARFGIPDHYPAMSAIDSGNTHSCGIDLQGSALCWGDNDFGQLNAPTDVSNFVSISASRGFHSCGLTSEGQVICWGLNTNGQASPPNNGFGFTKIYTDYQSSCGLRDDGEIECWGGEDPNDPSRLFGDGPYSQYIQERRGGCAILADGEFVCGDGSSSIMTGRYSDIVFTYPHICGLTLEGDLSCIKEPVSSTTENPTSTLTGTYSKIIRSAYQSICALSVEGQIECAGRQGNGLIPPGTERVVPSPVGVDVTVYSSTAAEVTWDRITGGRTGTIAGYEVFRNDEVLGFVEGTSYFDDTLAEGLEYRYVVRAVSFDGVLSEFSDEVVVTASGSTGTVTTYLVPERPGEPINGEALVYSDTLIELVWDRPASSEVRGYEVRRNGAFIGYTQGISYVDDRVAGGNCYRYSILPVHDDEHFLGLLDIVASTGDIPGCE